MPCFGQMAATLRAKLIDLPLTNAAHLPPKKPKKPKKKA